MRKLSIKKVGNYRGEHGKSKFDVECPFCGKISTVYAWSFASVGKKCSCGAKLTDKHNAIKR